LQKSSPCLVIVAHYTMANHHYNYPCNVGKENQNTEVGPYQVHVILARKRRKKHEVLTRYSSIHRLQKHWLCRRRRRTPNHLWPTWMKCLFIQYYRDVVLGQRPRGKDYYLPVGGRYYGLTTTVTGREVYIIERRF
jgi:hypothetical protein